jgi:translation initiation factor IF-2
MSETKETSDKTLRGNTRKPLSLKRTVESGHVRQSFSHGRSKSVVVEVKKKRTISSPGAPEAEEIKASEVALESELASVEAQQRAGGLSVDELEKRRRAWEAEKERAGIEAAEAMRLEQLRLDEEARLAKLTPPPPTADQPAAEEAVEPAVAKAPETPAPASNGAAVARTPEKPKIEPRRPEIVKRPGGRPQEVEAEAEEEARGKKKGAKPVRSPAKIGDERRASSSPLTTPSTRPSASARWPRCGGGASARSCARPACRRRATRSCVR